MDDGGPKADVASGSEARRAASAATGERPSRTSRSAVPDPRDIDGRPAAGAKADGGRRGSRSRRSSSATPQQNTSSQRHKHRSQANGSPAEGAGANLRPKDSQEAQDGSRRPRALLSCCKGETHSHREGFRRLARRLHDAGALAACFAEVSAEHGRSASTSSATTTGKSQRESVCCSLRRTTAQMRTWHVVGDTMVAIVYSNRSITLSINSEIYYIMYSVPSMTDGCRSSAQGGSLRSSTRGRRPLQTGR